MKKYLFLPLLFSFFVTLSLHAQDKPDFYTKHWQRVHQYELDDLPKSAAAVVDSIYDRAKTALS